MQHCAKTFLKKLNTELRDKSLTAERLCQILNVKLVGAGVSINWCKPVVLNLGPLNEGASFKLLAYGCLSWTGANLEVYKSKDGMWHSTVVDGVKDNE